MALIPPFGILVTFKDRRASNPYREYPREILNAPENHTVYMVETDLTKCPSWRGKQRRWTNQALGTMSFHERPWALSLQMMWRGYKPQCFIASIRMTPSYLVSDLNQGISSVWNVLLLLTLRGIIESH